MVRSEGGKTEVVKVPGNVAHVRKYSEALLGRAVLVVEGDTEVGVCRALDTCWLAQGDEPMALRGVVVADGGGNGAPNAALSMRKLGCPVLYFGDSDVSLNPGAEVLKAQGILTILWDDQMSIEQRIFTDLPWIALQELLSLAVELQGENKIRASVIGQGIAKEQLANAPGEWAENSELARALGLAAKKGEWFKSLDRGEQLGLIVTKHLPSIPKTDLARKVEGLRTWIRNI